VTKGSALHTAKATTPDQALTNLLSDVQRRNWDRAFADVRPPAGDGTGFHSGLVRIERKPALLLQSGRLYVRPLHITNDEAQMRVRLHFSTPVGPLEDVRDFHLVRDGDVWKTEWPKVQVPAFLQK